MDSYTWNLSSPEQLLSLFGSIVILIAYFLMASQPDKKMLYFSLSLLGGIVLLFVALIYHNLGFIFLEVSWISINAWGIWRTYKQARK